MWKTYNEKEISAWKKLWGKEEKVCKFANYFLISAEHITLYSKHRRDSSSDKKGSVSLASAMPYGDLLPATDTKHQQQGKASFYKFCSYSGLLQETIYLLSKQLYLNSVLKLMPCISQSWSIPFHFPLFPYLYAKSVLHQFSLNAKLSIMKQWP